MDSGTIFKAYAIGGHTLVGIMNKQRPDDQGNCFGVFDREVTRDDIINEKATEYRIVNFNVENLEALLELGLTWPIQCKILEGRKAIIHDPRIGERWYDTHFCEVCCPRHLLPVPQLQAHERAIMRGERDEVGRFVKINIGTCAAEYQ